VLPEMSGQLDVLGTKKQISPRVNADLQIQNGPIELF
jgi:hypothetical protein